jgi:transcriptional regulator with XRE-family HTH domain
MRIVTIRRAAGVTQKKLADELQVDRSTIAKWEGGASLPRAELLPKIAAILGCSIDDLLSEEGEQRNE